MWFHLWSWIFLWLLSSCYICHGCMYWLSFSFKRAHMPTMASCLRSSLEEGCSLSYGHLSSVQLSLLLFGSFQWGLHSPVYHGEFNHWAEHCMYNIGRGVTPRLVEATAKGRDIDTILSMQNFCRFPHPPPPQYLSALILSLSLSLSPGCFASTKRRGGKSTFRGTSCSLTSMRLVLQRFVDQLWPVTQLPQRTSLQRRPMPSTLWLEIPVTPVLACDQQFYKETEFLNLYLPHLPLIALHTLTHMQSPLLFLWLCTKKRQFSWIS